MKNVLKITWFSVLLVLGVIFTAPKQANALFLDRLFDDAPDGPHCLLMDCDDNYDNNNQGYYPSTVDNSVNNSYNNNTGSFNTGGTTVVDGTPTYTYTPTPTYNPPHYDSPLTVECYSTNSLGTVGTTVEWRASPNGGNNSYHITWSGTDGLSGQGTAVFKTYSYAGTKNASVTVNSGGQYISKNCSSSVSVYNYNNTYHQTPTYNYNNYNPTPTYYTPQVQYYTQPTVYYSQPISYANNLQVGCAAGVTSAKVGSTVTWSAEGVLGGYNSSSFSYSWSGTNGLSGNGSSVSKAYTTAGTKTATVTATAPNGQSQTVSCSNSVSVKAATVAKKVVSKEGASPTPVQVVYVNAPEKVSAASLFSLNNVPWGWVAVLIILILIGLVLYLIFNKRKI